MSATTKTPTDDKRATRRARRERRWGNKSLRSALAVIGFLSVTLWGLVIPGASASNCTWVEAKYHLACSTDPAISKAVLGTASAGAVGFAFGGPFGFLAGVTGGILNSLISTIH